MAALPFMMPPMSVMRYPTGWFYKWYKKTVIDRLSDSADVSAEALYYLGTAPELAQTSDVFFHLTTQEELTPPAQDLAAAAALLNKTNDFLRESGLSL